jgi:hypothetical protein
MSPSRQRRAAQAGLPLIALVGGCYKEPVAITTYPPAPADIVERWYARGALMRSDT